MAINEQQRNKILMFGALAGAVTPFIMMYLVKPVLDFLGTFAPDLSIKLANPTIAINIRESLTGINGGISAWMLNVLGIGIPTLPGPEIVMTIVQSAIGGAVFFLVGAYAADMAGMLAGNANKKTRTVIFFGSLLTAFIVGGFAVPAIGITLVNTLIAFAVNAAILAFALVAVDDAAKLGLNPF